MIAASLIPFWSECSESVELELGKVGFASFETGFAFCFILDDHEVFQDQGIHVGRQEASIRVFRRADNRFAAHVETGVNQHGAAGQPVEGFEQAVKARVALAHRRSGSGHCNQRGLRRGSRNAQR